MKTEIIKCDRCKREQPYTASALSEFRLRIKIEHCFYCDGEPSVSFQEYDFCRKCEDEFLKAMDDLTNAK